MLFQRISSSHKGFIQHLLRSVQILVTILLIIWLISQVEWHGFYKSILELRWLYLVLSFGFILVTHLINIFRWSYLVPRKSVSYGKLIRYYGTGLFSNFFLPTGIGGDGVRIALLQKNVSIAIAVASVILDRLIGFLALFMWIIFVWKEKIPIQIHIQPTSNLLYRGLLICLIAAVLVITLSGLVRFIKKGSVKSISNFYQRLIYSILQIINFLKVSPNKWLNVLGITFLLSIFAQFTYVLSYWSVIKSLSISAPFSTSIWIVLISSIALLAPVSINGLGLQENIYLLILQTYGISSVIAFSMGIVMRVLFTLVGLIGGLITLLWSTSDSREHSNSV